MNIPENNAPAPSSSRRDLVQKTLKIVAWMLPFIIAAGAAVFFYVQWQKAQQQVQAPTQSGQAAEASREEIEDVVKELSKIVMLPQGETPTLSTIKNKNSLTENRDFFRDAENGDQVLVYQQAKKAFLYRPRTKKLINLAPINIADTVAGQAQPTTAFASAETTEKDAAENTRALSPEGESLTVELRNGTDQQGLTYDFEPKLLAAFEQTEVINRNNASRDNYAESVVAAVTLTKKVQAQQIANELGFAFADLPAGEKSSEADVLIILGIDQL